MPKIDPAKLKSYMSQVEEDDMVAGPDLEDEGGEDYLEDATEELEESGASGDYASFLEALFTNGSAVQAAASALMLGLDVDDLPAQSKARLKKALSSLPSDLASGIKEHLAGMEFDDLHEMVENLEEAGAIENDGSVVPFLYWAARLS